MNIRRPIDYSAMFTSLDALMALNLPQMELYSEIGRLVSARPEKGAAVAAAGYLTNTYPDASGFSPRNLRRMREFYRAYENTPEVLVQAMTIGWTQNIVILENCATAEECAWYIAAVRCFHWSKTELLEKIKEESHEDNTLLLCSTETAEDELPLSDVDISDAVTPNVNSQANFSRLADPDVIHWTKQEVQDQQERGVENVSVQNQCCHRLRSVGPVRECPGLAETGLLPPIERLPVQRRVRPGLPSLWPPANGKNHPAPPGCIGHDAGGRGENGLY